MIPRNLITQLAAVAAAIFTYRALADRPAAPRPTAAPFAIGDLVTIAGYEGQLYYVDCYTESRQTDDTGTITDTHYDLTCAATGEYEIAFAEDLTLIARAAHAERYLDDFEYMPPAADYNPIGAILMPKQTPPTPREISAIEAAQRQQTRQRKAALTDRLLDQRQQYRELAVFFGGGYDGNLAQIDEDLRTFALVDLPAASFMNDVELRIEQRVAHRTYDAPLKPEVSE